MYMLAREFVKLNSVMFAALLVTLTLFYLMQMLIRTDESNNQVPLVFPVIDARMPEFDPIIYESIDRPDPIDPPETVEDIATDRVVDVGLLPRIADYPHDIDLVTPEINGLTISDTSMIPMVRATPTYPARALQRRIEGFVVVSFTVNTLGNVEEPSVIYAEPEGYFERAALQTIAKWKYAPRIENGQPVPVADVQQRISFEIRN